MESEAHRTQTSTRDAARRGSRGSRNAVILVLAAAMGSLLAACGSPDHSASPPQQSTTSSSSPPSTSTTTTLPAALSTGPLQISASVALPIPANESVTATEAPNGAVFAAPESHDPTISTVVWVIDGNGPAAIAEHVDSGVSALAADSTNLYVANYNNVIAFDRSTGNQIGEWNLPPINSANTSDADLVSMAATNGQVLVMITQGNLQSVYRFRASSTNAPQLIARGTSSAFGPNGSVYYERSDNHLVALSASGATTVGPALPDSPTASGGGIADVDAVAGGLVWVSEPAGQGLDTQWSPYNDTTLQPMGKYSGSVTEQIADTQAGALVLVPPVGPGNCPQGSSTSSNSCVYRISPTALLSDQVVVGAADELLGPDPAVITASPTTSNLQVDRLT